MIVSDQIGGRHEIGRGGMTICDWFELIDCMKRVRAEFVPHVSGPAEIPSGLCKGRRFLPSSTSS